MIYMHYYTVSDILSTSTMYSIKMKLLVYLVIRKESFVCLKGEPREVMGGGDGR